MAFSQRNDVTQFLHSLQSADAAPAADLLGEESFDFAMFTNTDFYDIDAGQTTSFNPSQTNRGRRTAARKQQPPPTPQQSSSHASPTSPDDAPSASSTIDDFSGLDFPLASDFNFPEYANSTFASPTITGFPDNLQNLQPIPAGHPAVYQGVHPQQNGFLPPGPRVAGDKRKSDALSPGRTFEEESRRAAEEDKRRRNTAASARFRVKKKQREQALEKSTKEMTEKLTSMENRISQLETENKWLKNIVLEKNGGNHDLLSKLLEDFHAKQQANGSPGSDDSDASLLKAPTSPEAREAGDSSG